VAIHFSVTEPLPGTEKPEIRAGRVTLRRFSRSDLDRRCEWPRYTDPVFAHLNLCLFTPRQRDQWFEREWRERSPYWFAVDDETGQLIGSITLRDVSRWQRSTRLGIHIHPGRLDMGYGTECMRLFLGYYFDMLGYRLLKLDVAAYNTRAIRCYEKVGFRLMFEFWRSNLSGIAWLKEASFARVRDSVRDNRGVEEIRHLEMHLDAGTYRELRGQGSQES
jgi:RimJ/RimL family protein N-acetyltransferase